jgi:hypothetical protein
MNIIQKTPARNIEKAYAYAISQQSKETYVYSTDYIAARDQYSQATIDYTNSVNAIKDTVTFTVVKSPNNPAATYLGYNNLLNALNASDVDTKFPTIVTEVLPRTTPKTYTYNYQKQNALDTLAQADAQINAIPKPVFNPPTQLGYYYYRLPTVESSGFLGNTYTYAYLSFLDNIAADNDYLSFLKNNSVSTLEGYPIIIIKREGGYAPEGSDEYNSTKKLSKLYGFDYDSLKRSVLNIDNSDLKAAGVVLGVDLFSSTVVSKKYIAGFFDLILPYGTIQPIQETSYETTSSPFGEGGSTTEEVTTYINPYIKISESSINLFLTVNTATKSVIGTSDSAFLQRLYTSPIINVTRTDDLGKYSITIYKYVNESSYLLMSIDGLTLQTYVATDTSYHGTEIGMFTFNAPVTTATDNTDPIILPLLRAPYLNLSSLDRIDLSRETGVLVVMSAQVVALTWVQEHAAFLQIVMIVLAVITMGSSLALVGTIETTTAAGLVTTTAVYSMTAFIVNFAINVVVILAVKELAAKLFPDNELVQIAATALTMYYLNDYNFSGSNSLDDVVDNPNLINNVLKYSQAVIDVYNESLKEKIKKDSERYTTELNELSEEYKENAAELEALPQLTDLIREDYKNSALSRNKVKPAETVDMFYTRTLNTNFAEVSTNPTYYYNSKLNLNNIS